MTRSSWLFCLAGALFVAGGSTAHSHPVHPDLLVEDVQVAASQPGRLRVKVANQGIAPAPPTQLRVYIHRGGTVLERIVVVPMLETGERQWVVIEAGFALAGADKVTLFIDELGQVDETDEGNNVFVFE